MGKAQGRALLRSAGPSGSSSLREEGSTASSHLRGRPVSAACREAVLLSVGGRGGRSALAGAESGSSSSPEATSAGKPVSWEEGRAPVAQRRPKAPAESFGRKWTAEAEVSRETR